MSPEDRVTRLRALWAEVLNVQTVADENHFLELGGDSIAATLCLNAIADEFDVVMPMGMLLESDVTFATFADAVAEAADTALSEGTPA